jgi:hypothetical protein
MKQKTFFSIKSVFMAVFALFLFPGLKGNSTRVASTACMGTNMVCNISTNVKLNAVGDRFSFNISDLTPMNLGQIVGTKQTTFSFPAPGQKRLYTFTIKGKEIKLLLITFSVKDILANVTNALKNAGISFTNMKNLVTSIKNAAQEALKINSLALSIVKVYKQMANEKQWTEVSTTILEDVNPASLLPADTAIDQNGVIQIRGTGPMTQIDVGRLG